VKIKLKKKVLRGGVVTPHPRESEVRGGWNQKTSESNKSNHVFQPNIDLKFPDSPLRPFCSAVTRFKVSTVYPEDVLPR